MDAPAGSSRGAAASMLVTANDGRLAPTALNQGQGSGTGLSPLIAASQALLLALQGRLQDPQQQKEGIPQLLHAVRTALGTSMPADLRANQRQHIWDDCCALWVSVLNACAKCLL